MTTIRATKFAAELPSPPGADRERAIYRAVVDLLTAPILWVEVRTAWRGRAARMFVSADALKIGNTEDAVRVAVNAETAQWIHDHLGTVMPTTRICELIWEQAHVRVSPCLQTPDAEMAHTHRMVRHSREIDEKVRCRAGLISNVGKHWVLTNRLATAGPNQAANYGWYKSDGTKWQNLGLAHDNQHVDYSQVVRLVRRDIIVDGRVMDIEEVGRSAELWGLVSSEGPLTVWRQPGTRPAPAPTPPPTVDYEDPATWRELRIGMKGPDVGGWQRQLMRDSHDLSPWNDDGDFGRVTHNSTVAWQRDRGLPATGVVDDATKARIGTAPPPRPEPTFPDAVPFVAGKNFTRAGRTQVDVVVIHTMEAAEASTTAENVAAWGAGPNAPQASWHYAIDDDSIVQCVREEDVAWAAPSRNHNGIQLEHAGYARQMAEQWEDVFSQRMLRLSAQLTARICKRWNIPVVSVDAAGLLANERGITTHWEVSKGPGRGLTDHVDPGRYFPMARYLEWVREGLDELDA